MRLPAADDGLHDFELTRENGYIWGNRRLVTVGSGSDPLDLVNLPRFDKPRTLRVDLQGPFSGSAVNVQFEAEVGRGDGFSELVTLAWDRTRATGVHVLYCSSLRVKVRYLSGAPIPANTYAAAWATLCDGSGRTDSKPQTFGNAPTATSVAQTAASQTIVPPSTTPTRRFMVANNPAAGTERLLLAYGRAATAADFDVIVNPYETHIDEAWQGSVNGLWTAAGAGFARVSRWAVE